MTLNISTSQHLKTRTRHTCSMWSVWCVVVFIPVLVYIYIYIGTYKYKYKNIYFRYYLQSTAAVQCRFLSIRR